MTWMRALATAAATAAAVLTAAPVQAAPVDPAFDLSKHSARAVAPGIGIGTYAADGESVDTCTAGWLVHDVGGQAGLLTAGHCYHGGGAAYYNTRDGVEGIGRFTHHVDEGSLGEDADIAVIGINNVTTPTGPVRTDSRVAGRRPTTLAADPAGLARGQQLCKFGLTTGLSCGPIVEVTPTKVRFAAASDVGDSGGPVYYRHADGTATPVGIVIRGTYEDDDPATVTGTVAELIGPWLQRWGLTVDTTPSTPNPVSYHH